MTEHVVAKIDELPPGSSRVVQLRNMQIGIFNLDGVVYALPNLCPHQFGPLCQGKVGGTMASGPETAWTYQWVREGEIISCPWHGIEFDLTTGKSLASSRLRVRQYPVSIVDGEIIVTIGSA